MTNRPWGELPQGQGLGAPSGPDFAPGAGGAQPAGQSTWGAVPQPGQTGPGQAVPQPGQAGPWPTAPQPAQGDPWAPASYGPPGLPPAPPPQAPRGGAGLVVAIVAAIVVAGILIGILVVSLKPKADVDADPTPSPARTTRASTRTTGSTETTGRTGSTGTTGTTGSFRELRVPVRFDTFTAGNEYGSGRWIGTPGSGASVGWWYKGTISGRSGQLVASIVHDAAIADLNPYSFENRSQVDGAVCGTWLTRYVACFIEVDDGFVGVQVGESNFAGAGTQTEVLRLVKAFRGALQ